MAFGLSIDWEDYFVAENIRKFCPENPVPRLDFSTKETLDLLDKHQVKATFFILGIAAKAHPELVKLIADKGHEIASHGFAHKLAYTQSEQEFTEDISSSKKLIEDLSGKIVSGYRAPNFSINQNTPWAYSALLNAGYKYDSSLYPIKHHRYGNPLGKRHVHQSKEGLTVVPLATYPSKLLKQNLPLAGGAYWRLFPMTYTNWGLKKLYKDKNNYFFYFHPWELDAKQPKITVSNKSHQFRHYYKLDKYVEILNRLFENYKFTNYSQILGLL